MSTTTREVIKELPDDPPDDVLFNNLYGLRTVELNRPAKLNALNGSMIRKIVPRLVEWEKSDMANVVVMKGAGDKAFCAGGDVAALAQDNKTGEEGQQRSTDFFALEYKLDHFVATYQKPYVAFMDGITMGGGVGLSIHAPFRIATERTVFAMPETTIGFFPDVGASFFLPRMAGAIGTYLGLTSARVTGADVFYSGIATHYLHSTSLPDLELRLAELRFRDWDSMEKRLKIIEMTIEEYVTGLPEPKQTAITGVHRPLVDECFGKHSVGDMIAALESIEKKGGPGGEWAQETLAVLRERSPTSLHVGLRQMRTAWSWSIAETFRREHQIAAKFMRHPDFTEGVEARLMGKEKRRTPQWKPATLEDIHPDDKIAQPFFDMQRGVPWLQLLNDRDYSEYPHRSFGIPTERDVQGVVAQRGKSRREVVDELVSRRGGRQGMDVIVADILARNTTEDAGGEAVWIQ